jgi:hypothetical protein
MMVKNLIFFQFHMFLSVNEGNICTPYGISHEDILPKRRVGKQRRS